LISDLPADSLPRIGVVSVELREVEDGREDSVGSEVVAGPAESIFVRISLVAEATL